MTDRHLFVFGLGYSALAFVRENRGDYRSIAGTVRSAEKARALRREGIDPFVFDGGTIEGGLCDALRHATHLLGSIAPDEGGDPALSAFAADIEAAPALGWIGYLSTVGVYGDRDGGWVDETTPPDPQSPRAKRRVAAEAAWTALGRRRGIPVALLRLAGIYGPGRNSFIHLADGSARRLIKPGQVFNRIHVDDIAAVIAAAARLRADGVFNVADDEPAPPQDVVAFAAALAGHPPLPDIDFATAALSPMARSFYGENRRVSNRRLAADLGVTLRHPNYRAALTALWREGWRGEPESASAPLQP